jgi:hypothetical protein
MKLYIKIIGSIVLFIAPFVLYYFDVISYSAYYVVDNVKVDKHALLVLPNDLAGLGISLVALPLYWLITIPLFIYFVSNFKLKK